MKKIDAAETILKIASHKTWNWMTPEYLNVILQALHKQVEKDTVATEESFGKDCCPHCHWPVRWIQEEFLTITYCPYCGQKVHVVPKEEECTNQNRHQD